MLLVVFKLCCYPIFLQYCVYFISNCFYYEKKANGFKCFVANDTNINHLFIIILTLTAKTKLNFETYLFRFYLKI